MKTEKITEKQGKLLHAIWECEFHDGVFPVEHAVWTNVATETLGRSAQGVITGLVKRGMVGISGSSTEDRVIWITAKGAEAIGKPTTEPVVPPVVAPAPAPKAEKATKSIQCTGCGAVGKWGKTALCGVCVDRAIAAPAPAPKTRGVTLDVEALNLREGALTELSRFAVSTWREYGINEADLDTLIIKGVSVRQHIATREQEIREAKNPLVALEKGKRSIFSSAMFLWAKGKGSGSQTPERLERAAFKAEALAKSLDKMGKDKNAEQQRERARLLRQAALTGERVERVKREKKAPALPHPCICGCGVQTKASFAPGHDSKVHSAANKAVKGKAVQTPGTLKAEIPTFTPEAIEYMRTRKWFTEAEIKKLVRR